jgi:hypothetical protein
VASRDGDSILTTPTPPDVSTTGNASSSASGTTTSLGTLFLEVLGVVILTILAGIGPRLGKITTFAMAGLLILWLITHATVLARLIPGTSVQQQG